LDSHLFILLTSPPLSLTPMIFGCVDSLITTSAGRSIPVFAGTLYNITGIGDASATYKIMKIPFLVIGIGIFV